VSLLKNEGFFAAQISTVEPLANGVFAQKRGF
jgi:hypothetical protein